MGLCLFPGDGDLTSPDIRWSCSGFKTFRQRLAQAEGFTLPDMWGSGGDRQWSEIASTLEPLLGRRLEPDQAVIERRHPAAFTDWLSALPRGLPVGPARSTRKPPAPESVPRVRASPIGRSGGTAPVPRDAGTSRRRGDTQ